MGSLSERGTLEPSRPTVIFWGVLTGAVAAIILVIGGGGADALIGLKDLTIVVAVPFVLVMLGMWVSLMKDLQRDPLMLRGEKGAAVVEATVVEGVSSHGDDFGLVVTEAGQPAKRDRV
ncbi:MAG: hypothetical protein GEU96_19740 [Propionibacteriales bacterium]|nr:hypothetical protein [Propionibacteriales bacterium]